MSNHPSITAPAPSFLVAALNALWRFCRGDSVQPARLSAIADEGCRAFRDGLPLSVCPYVRAQEVDKWRAGWSDAQIRKEILAMVAASFRATEMSKERQISHLLAA